MDAGEVVEPIFFELFHTSLFKFGHLFMAVRVKSLEVSEITPVSRRSKCLNFRVPSYLFAPFVRVGELIDILRWQVSDLRVIHTL